ncbi:MAG: type II/IV secretion system protein [Parcubacteria group bacterium]|nr:type II/IV secretion system protein [Parcubacteria group bacterium]
MILSNDDIKQILIGQGIVPEEEMRLAEETAGTLGKNLLDVLIEKGIIAEKYFGEVAGWYFKVPYIDLKRTQIPLEILNLVPQEIAEEYHIIVFKKEDKKVFLAMENPKDLEAIELVRKKTRSEVTSYFMTRGSFNYALGLYFQNFEKQLPSLIEKSIAAVKATGEQGAKEAPVVKILDLILTYAAAKGASDIHIDKFLGEIIVRLRIEGALFDVLKLPPKIYDPLLARIKILANLKIDEHYQPQDGRFTFSFQKEKVSVRVSILPTEEGESIETRVLSELGRPKNLEETGLSGRQLEIVQEELKKSFGLILVVGPTGSGKTTTLYNMINVLNNPRVSIETIEDPIEYTIPRLNQIQVNPKTGIDFAVGLRSILRHDPNIVMVGEIRDEETAEIVIHAALTGQLVLSTLHTQDAIGSLTRLLDLKIRPFLLSSTLNAAIAQRLVRRPCLVCIGSYQPSPLVLEAAEKEFGVSLGGRQFFHGTGCPQCGGSGFQGRIGIFEVLKFSDAIRQMIFRGEADQKILTQAKKEGMTTLFEDGLEKVDAGLTTIEEVLRVL